MATYEDVITQVERELRPLDAFPDASTKLAEQLEAIHRYTLGLQKMLPLQKLPITKSNTLGKVAYLNSQLLEASLPQDINIARPDLGISQVQIVNDSVPPKEDFIKFSELVSFGALKDASANSYHSTELMASIDVSSKKIYTFANIAEVFVFYSKEQALAVAGDYTDVTIELDENSIDVLVEAVCAHFSSVNAKDYSTSQIHSTLSQILKE